MMEADAPRSPVGSPTGVTYSDRFIPSRTGSNLASYLVELGEENAGAAAHSSEREARVCFCACASRALRRLRLPCLPRASRRRSDGSWRGCACR
jgi:hypothetical protein